MEPEPTQLCARCLELTCVGPKLLTTTCRSISAYRTSSTSCACCDFLLRIFERTGDKVLSRFAQFNKSTLDHFPAELSTTRDEAFPSGLRTLSVNAVLQLPNNFSYTSRCTISSCETSSECATLESWRAFPTTIGTKLLQIREWLRFCDERHPSCQLSRHLSVPTRLIELDTTKSNSARLVSTHDINITGLKYTTLSYGCGDWEPVKTFRENLSVFHAAIPWTDLPRTLTDAMSFTREIGLRYIWIDTLCIIQDDPLDWETEADKIHDIYAGSHLTFHACEADSFTGGLFTEKLKPAIYHQQSSRGFFATPGTDGKKDIRLHFVPEHGMSKTQSPLSNGSWCCQETHLCRRMVKISGTGELQWHCLTETRFETGDRQAAGPTLQPRAFNLEGIDAEKNVFGLDDIKWNRLWWQYMENYSRHRLSSTRDRFAALATLAGLARLYQQRTGDTPCLGLWRNSLQEDLLWMRCDSAPDDRSDSHSMPAPAPSWSPFSCHRGIEFSPWGKPNTTPAESCLEILHCSVEWSGKPFVSDLQESVLIVNGPVREMHLAEATEINSCNPRYFNIDHEAVDFGKSNIPWRCALQWDHEGYRPPQKWLCLLVERRQPTNWKLNAETFLVLEPIEDESSEVSYRRVGIGSLGRNRAHGIKDAYEWKFNLANRLTVNML